MKERNTCKMVGKTTPFFFPFPFFLSRFFLLFLVFSVISLRFFDISEDDDGLFFIDRLKIGNDGLFFVFSSSSLGRLMEGES